MSLPVVVFSSSLLWLFCVSLAQLQQPNVLHHQDFGVALFLPLSSHHGNISLSRFAGHRPSRHLSDGVDVNAKMTLYDDLLTKGYYTTRLWIGTPPQEFALIVDTGSTVTYVPCSSCTQCGTHQDPGFKPEESSTYKPVPCGPKCAECDSAKQQCKYQRRYAEMSTSEGLLGDDLISFGNMSTLGPERLVFGCETRETGDIYEQKADGIMGLGRGHLSVVDQLVEQKAMTSSFSLCYGGMDEGGGAMIMGAHVTPQDMIFTQSDFSRSAYYNLGLQQVIVAGTPLPLDQGIFDSNFGTILDSGTTYAYFPDKAFQAFTTALTQNVKLQKIPGPDPHFPDICFEGAGSDVSKLSDHFPEVQLKFGDGKIVSLAPENYLFKHMKLKGGYCLGIFSNGKDSATLLGGIIVRNMLVTYDRINHQIGFWRTNCSDLWNNLQSTASPQLVPPPPPPPPPPFRAPEPSSVMVPQGPSSVSEGSGCVSAYVNMELYLDMNYSYFDSIKSRFKDDLSDALQVDASQVQVVNFTNSGGNLTVFISVHVAATDEHLLKNHTQDIVSHLSNQQVRLGDPFGDYQLVSWDVKQLNGRSTNSKSLWTLTAVVLPLALAVLVLTAIGLLIWWRGWRFRDQKYVALQQSVEMSDQVQQP